MLLVCFLYFQICFKITFIYSFLFLINFYIYIIKILK